MEILSYFITFILVFSIFALSFISPFLFFILLVEENCKTLLFIYFFLVLSIYLSYIFIKFLNDYLKKKKKS